MKVTLEYDEQTGLLSDKNTAITTHFGLEPFTETAIDQTEKLCKLKASGFQVNEIMQLIREGML